MDPLIAAADPEDPALDLLFARHRADMHAQTPPESIHMLDRGALKSPDIAFFALRPPGGDAPVAMGALTRLDAHHGEIKSMHVLAENRGGGWAGGLLDHLLAEARAQGMTRVSLETGAEPIFAPARAFYARAGFEVCGPFGDYGPDPNSVFMTLRLQPGLQAGGAPL